MKGWIWTAALLLSSMTVADASAPDVPKRKKNKSSVRMETAKPAKKLDLKKNKEKTAKSYAYTHKPTKVMKKHKKTIFWANNL